MVVLMGSGAETARETAAAFMSLARSVGVLQVRLYRPFSATHFSRRCRAVPRAIAVLEQTKEPGAPGEPLYLDVVIRWRKRSAAASVRDAAGDRWPLRAVVEGFQSGDGESGVRRTAAERTARTASPSASMTM